MIYCPVGAGGVGGGLITSHKEVGDCVLQEDESEGTDKGRKREEECVKRERERSR